MRRRDDEDDRIVPFCLTGRLRLDAMNSADDRAARVAWARALREQGLLLREIAADLGVALKTVYSWLSDPDGAKLKARKASYRVRCRDCGGPAYGVGYRAATRCRSWGSDHKSAWDNAKR
jgi:hypothetical protein